MGNTVGSLTKEQISVIVGSILGDGYLRIVPNRMNALLEINHSIKQKDYVDWKYEKLKKLVNSPPKSYKSNGNRIAYRFNTRQHPFLTELHSEYYKDRKKTIHRIELNALVLSVWFMDDGSKTYCTYYLNTQQFDYNSQLQLIRALNDYDICSSLNKDKDYYRIRIKQESADKFRRLIKDHVVSSMKYKL